MKKVQIKLSYIDCCNYIRDVKGLETFAKLTDDQLQIWNELRRLTQCVVDKLAEYENKEWEEWPGFRYYNPDNSNPRYLEYKLDGEFSFTTDKMAYLMSVAKATGINVTIKYDMTGLILQFFSRMIYEGRHIKIDSLNNGIATLLIDPEKKEVQMINVSAKQRTIIRDLSENPLVEIPNVLLGDERVIYIESVRYIISGSCLNIDLDGVTKLIYVRKFPKEQGGDK